MRPTAVSLLLAVAMVAGCGTLARPDTPDVTRLYIDGAGADLPRAEAVALSVLVATPRTMPGYATPRFAYMEDDLQIEYYGRHEWAAEPARMVQPAVVRALEQSGRFAAVVAAPASAAADLRLELQVIKLLHDYRRGQAVLVFTVRAQLTGIGNREVLATRLFELREPAGHGPVRGAAAADRALAHFLEQLAEFCVEHTGG